MKQKLFENVGGNKFRLLTESKDMQTTLLRGGISKIFANAGKEVSYTMLENMGLGYIKDVTEAKRTALQEAKTIAEQFGYVDNANAQKFVKEVGVPMEQDVPQPGGEDDEVREVSIAKLIRDIADRHQGDADFVRVGRLATEILKMHGAQ